MNNNNIETMLKKCPEFAPGAELKDKIIQKARAAGIELSAVGRRRAWVRRFAAVAACFVFLIALTVTGFGFYYEDYETVYLDVNPSIALTLNRFEVVNAVHCFNDDASAALSSMDLKGKKAEDALEAVLGSYEEQGYFEDAEIFISVFSDKNKNGDRLLEKLKNKAESIKENRGYSVNTEKVDNTDKEDAKNAGISPAKYKIIKAIMRKDSGYTFEELKGMKMSELKKLLTELR